MNRVIHQETLLQNQKKVKIQLKRSNFEDIFCHLLEKPSFDLSNLFGPLGKKEIRVKAGEPLTIDLLILGSPTPIVTWTKDGETVQPTREFVSFSLVFRLFIFVSFRCFQNAIRKR